MNALRDHEFTLVYEGVEFSFDWANKDFIRCNKGKVAVAMCDEMDKVGEILLPPDAAGSVRPDVGVVIGKGEDVELDVGSVVVCKYGHGKVVKGLGADRFYFSGQTRLFGYCGGTLLDDSTQGDPGVMAHPINWWEGVILVIEEETARPTGANTWARLTKIDKIGSIHLSSGASKYDPVIEVVACGPECELITKPCKAVMHEGEWTFVPWNGESFAVVPEEAIYCVIE